jgi:hypothetical protein
VGTIVALSGAVAPDCRRESGKAPYAVGDFVQISLNGFGLIENQNDMNDYPWGLVYFQADGEDEGHVYVSTGNGIDDQFLYQLGLPRYSDSPFRPGEIRRFRPDLGSSNWQRVLDAREFEPGPVYSTTGFRALYAYRPPGEDQPNYLYAGSAFEAPSLWRSSTGEPSSWEVVWAESRKGSFRAMVAHDGIMYFNFTPGGEIGDGSPGEIWAHDGVDVWSVIDDGFGNPDNGGVWALASFNGYLYASLANMETGFEIWKLEGPDQAPPVQVMANGGPDPANQAAATCLVYRDKLYFGTQILGAVKGAQIIRFDKDDIMEVVVGPDSVSGYGSGFDRDMNAYVWSMTSLNDQLYVGTWDLATVLQYLADYRAISRNPESLNLDPWYENTNRAVNGTKRAPTVLSTVIEAGGDIYCSPDGDTFYPVSTNGLGDPYNIGVRNMLGVGNHLYVGMANLTEGLEIWRGTALDPQR